MKNKEEIESLLGTLYDSCVEGHSGEWDCSTSEGRESFIDMATIIEELASELKAHINNKKEFVED